MSEYTSPERAAEIAWAKRVRGAIFRCGGCPMCTRRVEGFGIAACGLTPQKRFPMCLTGNNGFDLDRGRIAA